MKCVGCNIERKLRFKQRTTCSSCYSREWVSKNRERRRELDRLNYEKHAGNRKAKVIDYQKTHWEDTLKYKRTWRKKNPDYSSAYRSLKLNATPKWANLDKIKKIYQNRPEGFHVDHIIPLQGENVCGLHVEYNLQYLPAKINMQKGNKVA